MLGQLARASAQGNPQQALALQSRLPALPKLSGISLEELEAKIAGMAPADFVQLFFALQSVTYSSSASTKMLGQLARVSSKGCLQQALALQTCVYFVAV